jgi:hypothetical protein
LPTVLKGVLKKRFQGTGQVITWMSMEGIRHEGNEERYLEFLESKNQTGYEDGFSRPLGMSVWPSCSQEASEHTVGE